MKILETGNLLAVADARLNHRLLAGFIISLCGNFFLKQFRCGHLLSNAKKHRTISNAGTRQASAPAISARADLGFYVLQDSGFCHLICLNRVLIDLKRFSNLLRIIIAQTEISHIIFHDLVKIIIQ